MNILLCILFLLFIRDSYAMDRDKSLSNQRPLATAGSLKPKRSQTIMGIKSPLPRTIRSTRISFDFEEHPIQFDLLDLTNPTTKIQLEKGFYELEALKYIRKYINPNSFVLDIGAHVGNHTVYFGKILGCTVHAFEPHKLARTILAGNIRLNDLEDQVKIHKFGIGGKAEPAIILTPNPSHPLDVTLSPSARGSVSMRTLDEMSWPDKVHLIRADMGSFLSGGLIGATDLLTRDHPFLWLNITESRGPNGLASIQKFLKNFGYESRGCVGHNYFWIYAPKP